MHCTRTRQQSPKEVESVDVNKKQQQNNESLNSRKRNEIPKVTTYFFFMVIIMVMIFPLILFYGTLCVIDSYVFVFS